MYTTTHIQPDKPPRATRFLNMRVLCGLCKFKCCNSPSLKVECTKEESIKLKLPVLFDQEGHCRCLTPTGCEHGPQRPVFCKLFPLQVTPDNKLIVSHWAILNCPMGSDFLLTQNRPRMVWATREGISGAKRKNLPETLIKDQDLTKWPTALEMGREALVEIYGQTGYDKIAKDLAELNRRDRGFGVYQK